MRTDRRSLAITLAAAVVVILVAQSDFELGKFWADHAMLTAILASLVIVVLTVAVVNEYLERRDRRRWRVLAQAVLFDLVQSARATWTGMFEILRLGRVETGNLETLQADARVLEDVERVSAAIRELLADPERRARLRPMMEGLASYYGDTIGRWAPVMLGAAPYAEMFDRHVELYSRIDWIASLLAHNEPAPDRSYRERRLTGSTVAAEQAGEVDDDWLHDYLLALTRLAPQLDLEAHREAFRLVPGDWWRERTAELAAESAD